MSRNISYDESTEYTTVHDIQYREFSDDDDRDEAEEGSEHRKVNHIANGLQNIEEVNDEQTSSASTAAATTATTTTTTATATATTQSGNNTDTSTENPAQANGPSHPDIWAAEVTVRDRMLGNRRRNSTGGTGAFSNTNVYGISSGVLSQQSVLPIRLQTSPSPVSGTNSYRYMYFPHIRIPIPQNVRRMLYSIEQPNKGKGLIKEECFSSDGRLICSPYGFGFRLLSFSDDCLELPKALAYQPENTHKLTELKYFKCHSDIVVSTRFSPIQPLLASGCLQGRVVWHQPKF